MPKQTPTIKGIFVNSHIKALRADKGPVAVIELEKIYGKPLKFKNLEDVPVSEEVKIIDGILDILYGKMPEPKKAFEAGRLHFRNFMRTPLARAIYAQSRVSAKATFMLAGKIASQVFKGVELKSESLGPRTVKFSLKNSAYPLEHFEGFFQEWINKLGFLGSVSSEQLGPGHYEYLLDWHEA